jgi:hypothetical protein
VGSGINKAQMRFYELFSVNRCVENSIFQRTIVRHQTTLNRVDQTNTTQNQVSSSFKERMKEKNKTKNFFVVESKIALSVEVTPQTFFIY